MWWLASWMGCGPGTPPTDGDTALSGTASGVAYTYNNSGTACLRTEGLAEVIVDFGDCLFCSEEIALSCEIEVDGDRIEVTAGGSLVVTPTCGDASTCAPVTTRCPLPALADGTWTLAYAGAEVPVQIPTADWVCTGDSAAL